MGYKHTTHWAKQDQKHVENKLPRQKFSLRSRPPFTAVPRGPVWKVPHGRLLSAFGHLARSAPNSGFWVLFGTFGAQKGQKHSKSTLWGTPSQVPKSTQKARCGALSGPAPGHSCTWRPIQAQSEIEQQPHTPNQAQVRCFWNPCDRDPQQKISKTWNSSKVP